MSPSAPCTVGDRGTRIHALVHALCVDAFEVLCPAYTAVVDSAEPQERLFRVLGCGCVKCVVGRWTSRRYCARAAVRARSSGRGRRDLGRI